MSDNIIDGEFTEKDKNFQEIQEIDNIENLSISASSIDTSTENVDDELVSELLVLNIDPQYDLYPFEDERPEHLFQAPTYGRQNGESIEGHQKFLTYAILPPGDRTIQRAYEDYWKDRHERKGGVPKSIPRSLFQLAKHWRWKERAYAADLTRYQKAEDRWVERDAERRDEDWDAGRILRNKALIALNKINVSGDERLSAATIARFIELASSLQDRSIPELQLNQTQITDLLASLPEDRQGRIIRILAAEIRG